MDMQTSPQSGSTTFPLWEVFFNLKLLFILLSTLMAFNFVEITL